MPERRGAGRVHLGDVAAETRDDAPARDDDTAQHQKASVVVKRPTFRSVAL